MRRIALTDVSAGRAIVEVDGSRYRKGVSPSLLVSELCLAPETAISSFLLRPPTNKIKSLADDSAMFSPPA
jgi:hypothetical protein